jgi:hypothetical protein
VSLENPQNPSALARAVVIIPSGARVLRYRDNQVCVTIATVYQRERGPRCFVRNLDSGDGGSIREEPEAEQHLCVAKGHGSLESYSIEVFGPHVGYPFRRGTNED